MARWVGIQWVLQSFSSEVMAQPKSATAQVKGTQTLSLPLPARCCLGRVPRDIPGCAPGSLGGHVKACPIFPPKEEERGSARYPHRFRRHLKMIIKGESISKEMPNGDLKRVKGSSLTRSNRGQHLPNPKFFWERWASFPKGRKHGGWYQGLGPRTVFRTATDPESHSIHTRWCSMRKLESTQEKRRLTGYLFVVFFCETWWTTSLMFLNSADSP